MKTMTAKTYGQLKVTDAEYARAKHLAWKQSGVRGEQMYQLKNYCEGRVHVRSDVEEALAFLRVECLPAASRASHCS